MNKLSIFLASSVLFALALQSCTKEVAESDFSDPAVSVQLSCSVPDFCTVSEDGDVSTKTNIDVDGNFTWNAADRLSFWPSSDAVFDGVQNQLAFKIASGAGTASAVFEGNGWGLKRGAKYYASYPYDSKSSYTSVALNYTGQSQTSNLSASHIGAYDFLHTSFTVPSNGSSPNIQFNHIGAMAKFTLTVPTDARSASFSKLTVSATSNILISSATYKPSADAVTLTPVYCSSLSMDLSNVTADGNGAVTLFMMMAPSNLAGQTLTVALTTTGGAKYEGTITPKNNQQAGHSYAYSSTLKSDQPSVEPIAVALSSSMISTNNPMQYVAYDYTPQGDWGGTNRAIGEVSGATAERQTKFDTKANLWDGNPATCYHTNFDIYVLGGSWGIREGTLVSDNYIQISLTAPLQKFKLYFQNPDDGQYLGNFDISVSSDGTNFTKLSGSPYTAPSAAFGSEVTVDNIDAGSQIQYIRILPTDGYANPIGSIQGRCGYFGLAELKLWCLDGSYTPGEPGKEIRVKDTPSTTPFLPRRWKSGMNVSTNSWYKYWSDPTNTWNTSNTDLWLPNCTHYCMGRAGEISKLPIFSNHELFNSGYANAQNWYANAKWSKGSTPALGAICVWNGGQYGHVATVERVYDDGSVDISQSSYQSTNRTFDNPKYFEYVKVKCVVGQVTSGIGWTFSGYVYNPHVNDIRKSRLTDRSQIEVFVDALVVRNDSMVATGESVLQGIYNVYEYSKNAAASHDWVKIADNAWIPVDAEWNTMYY